MANVHNDPMQFLAEAGIVGFGVIIAILVVVIRPAVGGYFWRKPALLFSSFGLLCVAVQSLIDLPFRSPAVLYCWLAILGGVSRLATPTTRSASTDDSARGGGDFSAHKC